MKVSKFSPIEEVKFNTKTMIGLCKSLSPHDMEKLVNLLDDTVNIIINEMNYDRTGSNILREIHYRILLPNILANKSRAAREYYYNFMRFMIILKKYYLNIIRTYNIIRFFYYYTSLFR